MNLALNLTACIAPDIELNVPIYNASGIHCTTLEELAELSASPYTGALVTKSCTLAPRNGNPSPRYCAFRTIDTVLGSINSMGLPNKGLDYYIAAATTLADKSPFFISVAGLTRDENVKMLAKLQNEDVDFAGVELNLSCPNVPGKPQTGYDFEAMTETLRRTTEVYDRLPLGVKLPPYFDIVHFDQAADVLCEFQSALSWIVCINSIGNGLVVDLRTNTTCIAPKGGLGGIGGAYIKPTALANVRSFRARLPNHIAVVGCGGVTRGLDIYEHILCGAEAVQIGTMLAEEGLSGLDRALTELKLVMRQKNYSCLADFRGKLETFDRSGISAEIDSKEVE